MRTSVGRPAFAASAQLGEEEALVISLGASKANVAEPRRFQPELWLHSAAERRAEGPSLGRVRLRAYATLLIADVLVVAAAFLFGNLLRFGEALAAPGLNYLAMFVPVFLALAFSRGAYAVDVLEKPRVGAFRALQALLLTACALLVALFYTKTSAEMSRAVFGAGVLTSAGLLLLARHELGSWLGRRNEWKFTNEVLLVDGTPADRSKFGNVIFAEKARLDPYRNDPKTADRLGRLLGGYDRVVLACSPDRRTPWVKRLKGVGIDVEVLTPELDYLGALALRRTPTGSAVLVVPGPLGLRDRIIKRALDIIVASLALLFFAPMMLLVALAVKVTSPGPVLFKQWRIGLGNRAFQVLKFRTMLTDATDAHGVQSARKDDNRLTPLGAFLRRTSIDELPQLLNVLWGSMSVVGPRPHAIGSTAEDHLFWDIDDRYFERGAVKPGITGLAQVLGFRGATSTRKDLTDRVQADLEYLANWSIGKDLTIMLRTLRVIVHPNAY